MIALVSDAANGIALEGQRDASVFLFTACASLATAVAFGLAPALRSTRVDVNRLLASGTRGALGNRGTARSGRAGGGGPGGAVAAAAGGRGAVRAQPACPDDTECGLRPRPRGDGDASTRWRPDIAAAAADALYRQLIERARAIPGVREATISNQRPVQRRFPRPDQLRRTHPAQAAKTCTPTGR